MKFQIIEPEFDNTWNFNGLVDVWIEETQVSTNILSVVVEYNEEIDYEEFPYLDLNLNFPGEENYDEILAIECEIISDRGLVLMVITY